MGRGSGLLADQLHWPTCKSLTPALRFWFAVDGGERTFEGVICNLRSIPKECYCGQAFAGKEGHLPDTGDAITNRDAGQLSAQSEGACPDAGDTIRNRDTRQVGAARE